MNRLMTGLLLSFLTILVCSGCEPEEVESARQATPTPTPPEPTPTLVPEPTPVPIPDVAGDYRVTSMVVGNARSTSIDIDGDGKSDYTGLEDALDAFVSFAMGRFETITAELVDAEILTPELSRTLLATLQRTLESFMSIETINEGLLIMVETDNWIQRMQTIEDGSVIMDFYIGSDAGGGYWTPDESLGDTLTGTYEELESSVDVYGNTITISVPLAPVGQEPTMWDFPIEQVRNVETFSPEMLDGAILGGGISVAEFDDFVNKILMLLGILDFMTEEQLAQLDEDIDVLLRSLSDIELENGDPAISLCLYYDAEAALIWESE